jgi:Ca-activated chloride channel family protein
MSVAAPLWLVIGILAAAAFLWLARVAARRAHGNALTYSNLAFLESATARRVDPALPIALAAALGIVLLGAAGAGVHAQISVPVRGAVVLCVDTSGSMRATDITPSRSEAAATAVRAFIDGAPDGTRLGIVAFASGAGLVQPLTTDKDALREAVGRIPFPNGGTAIGDALETAAEALPSNGKRAIVLITDGVNNLGSDPQAVAQSVGGNGIEIDTIGIGTAESGQIIAGTADEATIDEEALRALAAAGHGTYARAGDAGALRSRLAGLAASTTRERHAVDLSIPLAIGGGLIALAALAGGVLAGRFP